MWYTHMIEYYSAIKKRKSPIYAYMEGPWGLYAKWDKKNRERQILNGIT